MVCNRCQKRPAIIFVQRMENGQMKNEGFCLHCARELHIKPVEDLMKQPDTDSIRRSLEQIGFRTDASAQFAAVEQLTERISLEYFRRTMRLSRNSSTVYFCLIECLETELRNIKTIIEGIRYGVPADGIMEMLVI